MERDQIVRDDFPVSRKGWDPNAVRAHLEEVASSMPTDSSPAAEPSLGDLAAGRIRGVLEAAETAANEIQSSAQADSDARLAEASARSEQILGDARAEANGVLSDARSEAEAVSSGAHAEAETVTSNARAEADAHVSATQLAVDGLVEAAQELRAQVARIGERFGAPGSGPGAEVPGPVIVPEPTPPTIPEPSPPLTPEPTPDPVPEPSPDPVPEPTPDPEPPMPDAPDLPQPQPPVPEPDPMPSAEEGTTDTGATTEDLIAQLRSPSAPVPEANGTTPAPDLSGPDVGAARLVAMNMALDGASREEISDQLATEFGEISNADELLDEVQARAER